jgi:hypothetical protein
MDKKLKEIVFGRFLNSTSMNNNNNHRYWYLFCFLARRESIVRSAFAVSWSLIKILSSWSWLLSRTIRPNFAADDSRGDDGASVGQF